jgi:L-lactate dehydrogenase (cytochrome)
MVSMWDTSKELNRCHSILDLRELARRRLPAPIFNYLDGAAETEVTARRNTAAFDEEHLVPKCLMNLTSVSTSTAVMGQRIEWPVICSPTGASRLYHPDGELAVARAAASAGTIYSLSVAGTHSIEAVAAASRGPKLFQILPFKDRGLTRELIARSRQSGFQALCLTVDATVRGKRERELRNGLGGAPRWSLASFNFALHPRWLFGQARQGSWSMPNIATRSGGEGLLASGRYLNEQLDPSVSWADVEEIARCWNGPFALKGIMCVDDARRAIEIGATTLFVSNHGGRQLDGAAAPIDVLPEIVAAVGDRIEVILDGGIRRGVHVLKALARGAKACSVGRPYLFGLSAGGEAGVKKALDILRAELVLAMQLSGCSNVRKIDPNILRRFSPRREAAA